MTFKRTFATHLTLIALGATMTACASSGAPTTPRPARNEGIPDCIAIEIQNTSLQGVAVWAEWDGSAGRRLGRLGLSARRSFRVRFRNAEVFLLFQRDGASGFTRSNSILPVPGDRLDIVYRQNGPGNLRRSGVTRC